MMARTTGRKGRGGPAARSAVETHRAWLELVDTDGPFLSVPALKRVYPTGIPRPEDDALARLKDAKPAFEKAWERWDLGRDDDAALDAYREARDAWVETVLTSVIGWGDLYTTDPPGTAAAEVLSPNHAVAVRATGALVHGELTGALVLVVDPVDSLRDRLEDGWAASPIDRMEQLLRASGVPIGVVTDGRWWAIVSARKDTMVASGIFDAQTWIEEPSARNALIALLDLTRLVGGDPKNRLTEIFFESVTQAEEITEALGVQVRRAVELLVQALSEGGLDAVRRGEPDPLPVDRAEVYEAAVTVMMRVVFLLFAEERGLLPQGALFTRGYGISEELDALAQRARDESDDALDATYLTWHRLLATSQALYRGVPTEDMRLASYGGSLFDPERFPFLTARDDRSTLAITVSDRVMLEVLRSVQIAELRGEPAKRISFRDIDVEQIGYIYEGLLGYSCKNTPEVTVGLIGKNGEEPEMPLAELEELAEAHPEPGALAAAILARVAETQAAAKPVSKAALTKAITAQPEDAERALRAVTTDAALRERLRPFIGIIRRDLRNRPLVVQPGGVLVVETPSRASAGAHYTPRSLAEEVVEHALKPLVFSPGPYDTPDETQWRPLSSDEILELNVADIACGSGAFLVAAARYLAARLEEAWVRQGETAGYTPRQLELRAIREVVATCLYGADINGMAVEMCKLSLWLVSLDPKLPFSFVDDKILHGNSLLGLTDVRQLKELHIDPPENQADRLFEGVGADGGLIHRLDIDRVLEQAKRLRGRLATPIDDSEPQRSGATKRRQWREYQELTAQLTDIADGVIAAGLKLGGKPGKALNEAYENLRIAVGAAYPAKGYPDRHHLDAILDAGLTPTVDTDYARWEPLHWIIQVPDVMERGGFDAIIGNPPFLGGRKISVASGSDYREWLVNHLAGGAKGSADLVAYFVLRAMEILTRRGTVGLIATNTLAQGDTREVGLDRMTAGGFTITRARQSRSWPVASANLEYAAIWGTRGTVDAGVPRFADEVEVHSITSLLEPAGRVEGTPLRLAENAGIAFIGCFVLGMGFVLEPKEAAAWIEAEPKNAEVLFPYLNGEDLNSRPDTSASRWVIDFVERPEGEARQFQTPWAHVAKSVRPERSKKDASKYPRMVYEWWKFWNSRPALREAISGLDEVLTIALVSKTVMPVRVPAGQVFSHMLGVFATDSYVDQAVLSSSLHQTWAIKFGSGMRNDPRYTPSDVFETFPRPESTEGLAEIGRTLDKERREIMLRRELGLTKLYNLVNDPEVADANDPDVARMRATHAELDRAVMEAYGWSDLALDHGFHTYRQMTRWTVSPTARVEILDRLLEENHRRAALQGNAPPAEGDAE